MRRLFLFSATLVFGAGAFAATPAHAQLSINPYPLKKEEPPPVAPAVPAANAPTALTANPQAAMPDSEPVSMQVEEDIVVTTKASVPIDAPFETDSFKPDHVLMNAQTSDAPLGESLSSTMDLIATLPRLSKRTFMGEESIVVAVPHMDVDAGERPAPRPQSLLDQVSRVMPEESPVVSEPAQVASSEIYGDDPITQMPVAMMPEMQGDNVYTFAKAMNKREQIALAEETVSYIDNEPVNVSFDAPMAAPEVVAPDMIMPEEVDMAMAESPPVMSAPDPIAQEVVHFAPAPATMPEYAPAPEYNETLSSGDMDQGDVNYDDHIVVSEIVNDMQENAMQGYETDKPEAPVDLRARSEESDVAMYEPVYQKVAEPVPVMPQAKAPPVEVAVAPAVAPVMNEDADQTPVAAVPSMTWQAFRGAMLYDVLASWGERASTDVLWDAAQNFKIQDNITIDGTFEEAVAAVLEQYNMQYTRPVGNLHLGAAGQKTLVIVSYQGA